VASSPSRRARPPAAPSCSATNWDTTSSALAKVHFGLSFLVCCKETVFTKTSFLSTTYHAEYDGGTVRVTIGQFSHSHGPRGPHMRDVILDRLTLESTTLDPCLPLGGDTGSPSPPRHSWLKNLSFSSRSTPGSALRSFCALSPPLHADAPSVQV